MGGAQALNTPPAVRTNNSVSKYFWEKEFERTLAEVMADLDAWRIVQEEVIDPNHPSTSKELLARITNATEPIFFLHQGLASTDAVVAIHNVGRYNGPIGAVPGPLENRVLGMMGDGSDTQIPAVIKFPEGLLGAHGEMLEPSECHVPDARTLMAHFNVPNNANQSIEHVVGLPNLRVKTAALMPIPASMAVYFLNPVSPLSCWLMLEQFALLMPPADRGKMAPLISWAKLTATHVTAPVRQPLLSRYTMVVHLFGGALTWVMGRAARFGRNAAPNAPAPADMMALIAAMNARTVALSARPPPPPPPPPPRTETYSPFERVMMDGWFALSDQDRTNGLEPDLWAAFEVEGRKKESVRRQLEVAFKPDVSSDYPMKVFVSPSMIQDTKDQNFGQNGMLDYDTCHRGASPYAVAPRSTIEIERIKRDDDDYDAATSTTPADRRAARSKPPQITYKYTEVLIVLTAYLLYLKVHFGPQCEHYEEVRAISRLMREHHTISHLYTARKLCYILWAIFVDARQFFNTTDGSPVSKLQHFRLALENNVVHEDFSCPIKDLITGQYCSVIDHASEEEAEPEAAPGPSAKKKARVTAVRKKHVLALHSKKLAKRADKVFADNPLASIIDICIKTKRKVQDIRIGPKGECQQYQVLGICDKKNGCTYSHSKVIPIKEKVAAAAKCLDEFLKL